MRIHAVTVSVDYSDILAEILGKNPVESTTIITASHDIATQELANSCGANLIISDSYKENGDTFNKSKMLNLGLKYVYDKYPNDWYLILDSDILFELHAKLILDTNKVYGAIRRMYSSKLDFEHSNYVIDTHLKPHEPHCLMGYFQLFSKTDIYYNEQYGNAWYSDTDFVMTNFNSYTNMKTLSEKIVTCHHFGPKDVNWDGRISKQWY